jgi:hypothetical protein
MRYSITLHVEVESKSIDKAYKYADAICDAVLETEDDKNGSVASVTIGDAEEVEDDEV